MKPLSKTEQKQLVSLLKRAKPGFLPAEIFYAVSKLMVTVTYTIVPFYNSDRLYVYLTRRDGNDPYWANQLQTLGKVILASDKTIKDTYVRLCHSEIKNFKIKKLPVFCGYVFDKIPRGKEIAIINYVILESKPDSGELYDINNLPKDLIPTEIKRIKMAAKKFQNIN